MTLQLIFLHMYIFILWLSTMLFKRAFDIVCCQRSAFKVCFISRVNLSKILQINLTDFHIISLYISLLQNQWEKLIGIQYRLLKIETCIIYNLKYNHRILREFPHGHAISIYFLITNFHLGHMNNWWDNININLVLLKMRLIMIQWNYLPLHNFQQN